MLNYLSTHNQMELGLPLMHRKPTCEPWVVAEDVGFGQLTIRENRQLTFKRSKLLKAFRGRF